MNRSFAVLAGFEHEAELLTGYVDLADHQETQKEKTPEAVYTETVLKLDAGTYGIVDGQEGFLDSIKRGASKVYEWIKSMIRAIRNWFSGGSKKEYNEAKAELKELKESDFQKSFEKQLENNLATFDREWAGTLNNISRNVGKETKQEIVTFVQTSVAEFKDDNEKKEKIVGTIINEIASKIHTRVKQVETRLAEIGRIDPTGQTMKNLGITREWELIQELTEGSEYAFSKEDQGRFGRQVETLVLVSEEIQSYLSKAVTSLDKMNEATRNNESESRNVARAGSVVKELSEIAGIYRDMVITVSSQVQIGFKKAETSIVKSALLDALKHSDDPANKYIQQAIDSL